MLRERKLNRKDEIYREITESDQETADLGSRLAKKIEEVFLDGESSRGIVVMLKGELGAGKTCLVKGAAGHLFPSRHVTSPSYTIMNEYAGEDIHLVHADLYRIESEEEIEYTGLYAQPEDNTILMIEWPGLVRDEWQDYILIEIEKRGDLSRLITLWAAGEVETSILKELKRSYESFRN